jgi:hypothetical protein
VVVQHIIRDSPKLICEVYRDDMVSPEARAALLLYAEMMDNLKIAEIPDDVHKTLEELRRHDLVSAGDEKVCGTVIRNVSLLVTVAAFEYF